MHNNREIIRPPVSPHDAHDAHDARHQILSYLDQAQLVLLAIANLTLFQEVVTKSREKPPIMHLPLMFLDFRWQSRTLS